MSISLPRALGLALASLALVACGGKKELPSDPLAYVPADTPYVIANRQGTPAAITDAWMGIYGSSITEMYADLPKDPMIAQIPGEMGTWIRALLPEFGNLSSTAGFVTMGLKADARFALYGYGVLPVYRFELSDPAKLAETVARVEERAGKSLAKRTVGEHSLWSFGDEKATVLFGPIAGYLVATIVPAKADEARISAQLGLTPPEQSLAGTAALADLDGAYGFDGRLSGYLDIQALARRLSGRDAADRAVMEAFGAELPEIGADCAADMDRLTAQFPRMVFGTPRFDAQAMDVTMVLELETTTANALQALAAPIPGAGIASRSIFDLALSANVPKAVSVLGGMADAVAAQPFKCADLANLNQSMAELKTALAEPTLAMAGSLTAARLGLTELELDPDTLEPTRVAAYATIASPTPMMFWGLAQQSLPPLASVTLATDGTVVTLPEGTAPLPVPLALKAVATAGSLAIGAGELADSDLALAAELPAPGDGTVLSYSMSGRFFSLLADNMPELPTIDAAPEAEEGMDSEGIDEGAADETESAASDAEAQAYAARQLEQSRAMMKALGEKVDRMDVALRLSPRGLEVHQRASLKP